jgi:hypothetical protein
LSAAERLLQGGMAPAELLSALGLVSASAEAVERAHDPDQPRVPAGSGETSGQWTNGDDGEGADEAPSPSQSNSATEPAGVQIASNSDDWAQYLNPVATADAAQANSGASSSKPAVPVVLPNGQQIPTGDNPPFLMSPTADLAPVAAAGREIGGIYSELLNSTEATDPNAIGVASMYLYANLGIYLGYGGIFDYQRQGNLVTGFVHFPKFANVSNFNVGLFCQQAGLTLNETEAIAGTFATIFSNSHHFIKPYFLADSASKYIVLGYQTGASGVFDPPSSR